jgi:hypothetical protein
LDRSLAGGSGWWCGELVKEPRRGKHRRGRGLVI